MNASKISGFVLLMAVSFMGNTWAAIELAKVNGQPLTDGDLKAALGGLNEGQREQILSDPRTKNQIVDSLVDQELLAQEAAKKKLDQDAEYKESLAAFRRQYLSEKLLKKELGSKVSKSAMEKYYEAHKLRYTTDQATASHILLNDEKTAREVLSEVKKEGADFNALAVKHSKDPSVEKNRGDIGMVEQNGPFVQEFKDAVAKAKEGEIVGPVKTLYGYHIVKVTKKKAGAVLNFSEVELRVKTALENEMKQQYLLGLRNDAKIDVKYEKIEGAAKKTAKKTK